DDPSLDRWEGSPLIGHYAVDDEGVPARRLSLVEDGILKDVPMGRSPIKERARSNGHGRGALNELPVARIGNLVIEPRSPVCEEELRGQLRRRAKEYGLPFGLLARRLEEETTVDKDDMLAAPILLYRLYVDDGRLELVRNARFSGTSLRALRDIVAASDRRF